MSPCSLSAWMTPCVQHFGSLILEVLQAGIPLRLFLARLPTLSPQSLHSGPWAGLFLTLLFPSVFTWHFLTRVQSPVQSPPSAAPTWALGMQRWMEKHPSPTTEQYPGQQTRATSIIPKVGKGLWATECQILFGGHVLKKIVVFVPRRSRDNTKSS